MSEKTPSERAQQAQTLVLQRLAAATQAAVATAMGASEATVNRIKTERMEDVLLMLAHLGLKVVPAEYKCVDPESYAFLTKTHERVMRVQPALIWDVDA